ncbi:hypothetical protein SEPL_108 [Salmonella phage SE_PL]|uniref:hypothetical protein n=1 Tax=Salmonella enterica TaxID=28901 RepID=UPI000FDFA808|nr:hypothetical protein CPT_Munch_319 [Salmonella phage Munch]EHX8550554.1 hypothetical protein [Salmonella enterica]MCP0435662.1 hypothetical protein [Salmonella enterica subsp. enterica serovar Mbandaka]QCW19016.1 hypothetical protein 7t3_0496 [Salmonella phage 7t3]QIG62721.1 hypothetical protein SEPL_108 [Salmonella phage SE_PL]WNV47426.1 hypothetical protein [Klebsiella phage fENko-Kae01]
MSKKLKENASSGATSAGSIASVSTGLHFPLMKRLPKTILFGGYTEVNMEKKDKK